MDKLRAQIFKAQKGNLTAFDGIVQRFYSIAFRYAYSILGDNDLAQDAVQESFIQAYLALPALREPLAFPMWLRTIVSRCSRRLLRHKSAPTVPLDEIADVASDTPTPPEVAEQKEIVDWIHEAIRQLPASERDITRLFYIKEYSQKEIAAILKLPVTTVL